ncbi:MAG: glycosyltransferase family 2 protein [Chitinispirillales bacterium]|jgi:glycosyltransferase involved in cell wall biosynthesis|nr:glycosyltransferase family 2 protein [Chitinispirillales bacterium]
MKKPTFSIITPMYRGASLVGESIESVLRQTAADWEMIIVDDCSPDGGEGVAVVRKYAKKDPRVKIIQSPVNRGSSGARNLAMDNAAGRYFAFLDADDIWDSDYLEKMKERIDENRDETVAIFFCGYRRKDSACQREVLPPYKSVGRKDFKRMLYHCPIFPSASILDTGKLKEKVRFNEELRNLRDDYVFWLNVMKQGLAAVGYDDVLVDYRMRDDSLTASKRKMIRPQWNIYRNVLGMDALRSLFYLTTWAVNGVVKYRRAV